jgi:hypothetical protein
VWNLVDRGTNVGVVVARTESGWSIISALMELGPIFWAERKLTDLVSLFAQALGDTSQAPTTERNVVVFCRTKTYLLAAVAAFAMHNRTLLTTEIASSSAASTSSDAKAAPSTTATATIASILGNGLDSILKVILTISNSLSSYQQSTIDLINVLKVHLLLAFKAVPEVSTPDQINSNPSPTPKKPTQSIRLAMHLDVMHYSPSLHELGVMCSIVQSTAQMGCE